MSDHFISLNRGQSGFADVDFTTGTSSTPSSDVELRIADGANLTRENVVLIVKGLQRYVTVKGLTTVIPNAKV